MAIIPTSSNTTNIANLPQSQLAVGSDLLILQTSNGTQVITFDNFNIVKTDLSGNATVTGNLTAYGNTTLGSVNTVSITASNYSTSYGPGITLANDYYDNFTIQNGIVLSANLTSLDYINNPLYVAVSGSLVSLSATTTGLTSTLNSQITSLNTSVVTTTASLYTTMQTLTTPRVLHAVLSAGTGITLTEDNINNKLTISTGAGTGIAKAWAVFGFVTSQSPGTIIYDGINAAPAGTTNILTYNISKITYVGTGTYKIDLPGGLINTGYALSLVSSSAKAGNNPSLSAAGPSLNIPANYTNTSCTIVNGDGTNKTDPGYISVTIFGY